MFTCPECSLPLIWQMDEELDESTVYSSYSCFDCEIDVWKYYKIEGEANG